ncbi:hypothetical protein DQ04_05111020 [Trypanosoma grayi]|uniref:hypothetical protein n=1 Tax=Trypanosoma grayi TaxID=71804 RepID=UPI0004F479DE|nr:hypothetical protein DQ04_05111020 [Trypanosoma grayi]KEG09500.1 hypothetical protein DQ04_05111020 [Trypanosoma grayi]
MFGRRVFASAGVPRHVWASLHIQSTRQAQRILPSLAPLPLATGCHLSGAAAAVSAWQAVSALEPPHGDEDPLLSSATLVCHRSCLSSLAASWCMPLRTIVWTLKNKFQHAAPLPLGECRRDVVGDGVAG